MNPFFQSPAVPKNALGRGLGTLMAGDKPAENAFAAQDQTTTSVGVGSLIRGTREEENIFAEKSPLPDAPAKPLVPSWYFFAADALLIAFAIVVFYRGGSPLRPLEAGLCTGALLLAAILGILGVWTASIRDRNR